MKDQKARGGVEDDVSRFREVLEAQAGKAAERTVRSKDGLVQVTVDQRLQVVRIEFLDKSIPHDRRDALQEATVEAINDALQQMVLASAEALLKVQAEMGWDSGAERRR
jgi:DNA-binding protein YbaB